ncbi:MAG: DUF975 family protein [Oscillospiraceae bacterium]|nr:DUF975 family protein [Oscillospiraceae bacterium]
MSLFGTLKRNSKTAIRGGYGRAALILLLLTGVWLVIGTFLMIATSAINSGVLLSNPTMEPQTDHTAMLEDNLVLFTGVQILSALFGLFLLTPLSLGVTGWYLSVVKGKPEPFGAVFGFFERAGRYFCSVWYGLNMSLRTLFWAFAFFALPMLLMLGGILFERQYLISENRQFAILSALGLALGGFLTLLAALLYIAYMNKYFLVAYLLANDESLTVIQAIRLSAKLTRGHRFGILWYTLSFFGWAVLSAVPGVIFYTKPYISTSLAMYAYYLIEKGGKKETLCATQEFSRYENSPADLPRGTPDQSGATLEWQDVLPAAPVPEETAEEPPAQAPEQQPGESGPANEPGKWPYI